MSAGEDELAILDNEDTAPGDEHAGTAGVAHGIIGYTIGALLAAGLTGVSFYIPHSSWVWAPSIPIALAVLAIAQMGVHLVFFIHVTTGPDSTNNILALAFGVLIVFLVIAGSLWIMDHLNHDLMPMSRLMQMQH